MLKMMNKNILYEVLVLFNSNYSISEMLSYYVIHKICCNK